MLWALAGCAPATATPYVYNSPKLTPYPTRTPSFTPSLVAGLTPTASTPLPISTTPTTYTIQAGDTLLEIARRFGVALADLLAANPGIVPETLRVGQVIQIPAPNTQVTLPPPAAAQLGQSACYPSGAGLYCLAPVTNLGTAYLENVQIQITLLDAQGQSLAAQEAWLPLDSLPAGETLPAVVFFPKIETFRTIQTELRTALLSDGTRFVPLQIRNLLVRVDWGGLTAQVQGQLGLVDSANSVRVIWLAGVAYDAEGKIVGVRRWEWSGLLATGEEVSFSFAVYSVGPPIARVEVLSEARP
ncbi:MAG: hypothetical protein DDG60_15820 [Anaerolineae bacterium]|nr:MAG: hypothetical protein DDG60_15820 [Anaerolineae bacterium]